MFEYFRHSIIKNAIIGFGDLFNDIYVARYNTANVEIERIRVPLAYGPKQKFITRIEQAAPNLVNNIEVRMPRMAFEIIDLSYDSTRKLMTTQKTVSYTTTAGSLSSRLEKVPYNLSIALNILTKNTEDALQIIEQIVPYFGPDFSLTFQEVANDTQVDVPIAIQSVSFNESYEGTFDERKVWVATITFQLKINLYGPVRTSKVITQTITNFINLDSYITLGTTGTARGAYIDYYGITGGTMATVTLTVTGGATAGSIGNTGSIHTHIREYP